MAEATQLISGEAEFELSLSEPKSWLIASRRHGLSMALVKPLQGRSPSSSPSEPLVADPLNPTGYSWWVPKAPL